MATIRSYTTIEQSKALVEILPLESADMCYRYYSGGMITGYGDYILAKSFITGKNVIRENDLPCWSLGALLGVLPDHFYDKTGRKTLGMDKGDTYYNVFYENKNSYIQKSANNPVDACVVMIEKLHELKIL